MTKFEDNESPYLTLAEQASAPATPGSGLWRAYAKSDGLYIVDDAGTETGPFGTGGGGGGATYTGVKVYRSAAYSLANNANTAIPWDAEDWDTDGFHDNTTNNSRLTVPTGLGGKYAVTITLAASATFTTTFWLVGIRRNGTGTGSDTEHGGRSNVPSYSASAIPATSVATVLDLAAGDYIEALAYQASGSSQALHTSYCGMAMHKIG